MMDRSHELDTARGIVNGLCYSLCAWLIVALIFWATFEWVT